MIFIKTTVETKKKIYNDDNNNSVGKKLQLYKIKNNFKNWGSCCNLPGSAPKGLEQDGRWPDTEAGVLLTALGKAGRQASPGVPGRTTGLIQWQRDASSKH